jgi:hypothetical protein
MSFLRPVLISILFINRCNFPLEHMSKRHEDVKGSGGVGSNILNLRRRHKTSVSFKN